jgi:hypothetical protein
MVKKRDIIPPNIVFNLGVDKLPSEGGKIKKKRGRKKKVVAPPEPNISEVIVKEVLPHQKFSRKTNLALDQLLEANRDKEKALMEKSIKSLIGGALTAEEEKERKKMAEQDYDETGKDIIAKWKRDMVESDKLQQQMREIPQIGQITLKIPPFFAVRSKKGWRLANPLTEMRNLAKRQHKLSINLKRANVKEPEIDMSAPTRAPTIDSFSPKDQEKLKKYLQAVKEGKEQEYLFKNKPRGFPATLYKNAIRAGYKETKSKVYRKNDLKSSAPPSKRGRPRKVLELVGEEEEVFEDHTDKRKSVEKPKEVAKAKSKLIIEDDEDEDFLKKWEEEVRKEGDRMLRYYSNNWSTSSEGERKSFMKDYADKKKSLSKERKKLGDERILPIVNKYMEDIKYKGTKEYADQRHKEIGAQVAERDKAVAEWIKEVKDIIKELSGSFTKERRKAISKRIDELQEKRGEWRSYPYIIEDTRPVNKELVEIYNKNRGRGSGLKKLMDNDDAEGQGGALSAKDLKDLLGASYDPKKDKVNDFEMDREISSKTSKVYYNPTTGQAVVAHMGTQGLLDWGNNAVYALGGKKAYKKTHRYKEAKRVQHRAEAKYGASNVSTIGHSQGGLQAEMLGKNSKETITLNKATRPFANKRSGNQYDIRTSGDIVSALNPFQKKNKNEIVLKSKSYNPLKEHSADTLGQLEEGHMIGKQDAPVEQVEEVEPIEGNGLVDWEDIKWGSFTKQFEEYKRQHPNSKIDDLEHFANSILANPSDYRKSTIKRARFYLNVLLKKKSQHNNIMPHTQGGRMIGLARPAVLPHHIGHPALVSDQYPRIPQAFTQVHMSHPVPIGHGLYAGGSGLGGRIDPAHILDSAYGGARRMLGVGVLDDIRHTAGKAYSKARTMSGVGIMEDAERVAKKSVSKAKPHLVKGSAEAKEYMKKIRGMKGGKIPAPHSRSPITDPSLLG